MTIRWIVGIASIGIPSILLVNEIYGSFIFSFSIPLFWTIACRGNSFKSLGLRKKNLGWAVIIGVASGCLLVVFGSVLFPLLGLTGNTITAADQLSFSLAEFRINFELTNELSYRLLLASDGIKGFVVYFLFNILAIGLGEELFWRGFIQRLISNKLPTVCAILLTSLLFALIHSYIFVFMPLNKGVAFLIIIGISGVIWGYMYERTKSIWSVAISHGIVAAVIWKYLFFTN